MIHRFASDPIIVYIFMLIVDIHVITLKIHSYKSEVYRQSKIYLANMFLNNMDNKHEKLHAITHVNKSQTHRALTPVNLSIFER